jgi:hypothetical protein
MKYVAVSYLNLQMVRPTGIEPVLRVPEKEKPQLTVIAGMQLSAFFCG